MNKFHTRIKFFSHNFFTRKSVFIIPYIYVVIAVQITAVMGLVSQPHQAGISNNNILNSGY